MQASRLRVPQYLNSPIPKIHHCCRASLDLKFYTTVALVSMQNDTYLNIISCGDMSGHTISVELLWTPEYCM